MSTTPAAELFGGPLDGLPLEMPKENILEFAYMDQGNGNWKARTTPSTIIPPQFFETYELTERKTREGRLIFQHNTFASNPPT